MSSLDQAFVKAYARRVHRRPADAQSPPAKHADAAANFVDDGTLHVNHSVADSTQVWIDPSEDQQIRADVAHPGPASRMAPPAATRPTVAPPAANQPAVRTPAASKPVAPVPPTNVAPTPNTPTAPAGRVVNSPLLFEMETYANGSPETNQHVHVAYALASLYETPAPTQTPPKTDPAPTGDTGASPATLGEQPPAPTTLRVDPSHAAAQEPAQQQQQQQPAVAASPAVETPPAVAGPQIASPPATPSRATLNPVWEVDNFDIPTAVTDLFFDSRLADQISRRMADAVKSGLGSVMVTSCREGEGRSTVAIGVALSAARGGLRVCLVDGDLDQPTLLDDLRLDLEAGWVDTIVSGQSIDDIAVRSLHDRLTLIPLLAPASPSGVTPRDIKNLLAQLRGSFDLLVIDAPASTSRSVADFAALVETALIVRDTTNTQQRQINAFAAELRSDGIRGVGVVDNFS